MNNYIALNPAIAACAAALCAYTVFVASECSRAAALSARAASARLPLGVGVAIGTGLWAVLALAVLAHGGLAFDAIGWLALAASWLAAVGASVLLFGAVLRWSSHPMRALACLGGCGGLLAVAYALADTAACVRPMDFQRPEHALGLLVASLLSAGALVAALALSPDAPARRRPALRTALVAGVAALALGHGVLTHLSHDGAVAAESLAAPALIGALVAALVAVIVLTMTRLTVRIERRLKQRAATLSNSLHQANANLQKLAYRDPLTRLSNRLMFERRLGAAIADADARRTRLTLMFIDLDGFKPINDGYGHATGDRVLRDIGERLRRVAPKGATIARLGGDEFVFLLRQPLSNGEASALATQLLGAMSPPFVVDGESLTLSCSIGIAAYPDCGSGDKLLAAGDTAIYVAKRAGGATFAFHDPESSAGSAFHTELMRDLRKAIELEQFELYYQPKISAETGQVSSVEALLRWNHPTHGLISPGVFVPLCERIGLIGRVGDWVLDQACRQLKQWQHSGVRMRVAINLSAQQLRRPGLIQRIETLLQTHGVRADQLTCEITESTAMCDLGQAHRTLMRLGRLGVRVSIDDFGTGHSSLAYLRQLPATELKIDRSFVSDVATSKDARAIVQAVIQMAHALELTVVAEGVETKEQRDMLLRLGCDEFQGFLFAKPLPAATLLRWALAERPAPRTFSNSLFMKSILSPLT